MATSIGSVGTVEPFNRDTDNWTYYCERLEQYFVANGISDDARQRARSLAYWMRWGYVPAYPKPGVSCKTNGKDVQ